MEAEVRRQTYLKALEVDLYLLRGQNGVAESNIESDPESFSADTWDGLRDAIAKCTRCALHQTRTQTVFGVGDPAAEWMIIGEAPGQEADRLGEPFVGRAGKLLDQMLCSVGLDRESVFIANILKCRPPNNRDPIQEEASACRSYLEQQIDFVRPKIILAVGRVAAQQLLLTETPVGRMRGKKYFMPDRNIPVVVTYHPAYLLRSPTQKRKGWEDLLFARKILREVEL